MPPRCSSSRRDPAVFAATAVVCSARCARSCLLPVAVQPAVCKWARNSLPPPPPPPLHHPPLTASSHTHTPLLYVSSHVVTVLWVAHRQRVRDMPVSRVWLAFGGFRHSDVAWCVAACQWLCSTRTSQRWCVCIVSTFCARVCGPVLWPPTSRTGQHQRCSRMFRSGLTLACVRVVRLSDVAVPSNR